MLEEHCNRRRFLGAGIALVAAELAMIGFAKSGKTAPSELPRIESGLSSLNSATEWINSQRLTSAGLRGKVVLINFCTYTCINWLRSLPYIRAWAKKYKNHGLVVIGVHTPEFTFEKDVANVRRAIQDMRIDYPVVIDNDYTIWDAFQNNYWPASYFIDTKGVIRHYQFGEGEYEQSEKIIQQLLAKSGIKDVDQQLVSVNSIGVEAAADWGNLKSPENYLGYDRTENFSSPGRTVLAKAHVYTLPESLKLNQWALSGNWTLHKKAIVLN
ncbi:MAG TPA: redoxin domain-containing protein, partial [Cyclobacteriaceae bacterium]